MDFLTQLLQPTGMWETIIFGLESAVKDYGLTLILITVLIRVLLLPFDMVNKYIMRNTSRKQAKLKPQLDKLQKMYGNNSQMLNQKTMELYKRENFSVGGTCLGMLVYMAVTMVVFFTLFSALNGIATYKQVNQFQTLENTYYITILNEMGTDTSTLSQEEIQTLIQGLTTEEIDANATAANEAIIEKYADIKSDFLWIKNIWKQDTSTEAILTYTEYEKVAGEDNVVTEAEYNRIMDPVKEVYGGQNGWYLLIVLSALTTFASMQLTTWMNKAKAKKKGIPYQDPVGSNKVLNYLMPVVMALFTFFYNAAFGIYIVTGSLFVLVTTPLTNWVAEKIDAKAEAKEQSKNAISYSRKQ